MPRSAARRAAAALFAMAFAAPALAAPPAAAGGAEPVDLEMVTRIRDEGFHRSQVMATAFHLTDVIGPRLTGSAGQRAANEWTRDRLAEWGLRAWIEEYEFGEGWTFRRSEVRMTAPVEGLLSALPEAWTPGTAGPVAGAAIRADLRTEEDLEKQKGKLAGKVVFLDEPRPPGEPLEEREAIGGEGDFRRWDDEGLAELGVFEIPEEERGGGWGERARKRRAFADKLHAFLVEEQVVALVGLSSRDHGIVRLGGGGSRGIAGRSRGIPSVVMAAEPYHRVLRLLDEGKEVQISRSTSRRRSTTPTAVAYNTVAEIPGGDLAGEVVMAGAHLDSWHAGTGATDNAAGCAVAMEAVRILKALGVQPRRTIRVALWTGEEQGLLGSRAYVEQHLADRPDADRSRGAGAAEVAAQADLADPAQARARPASPPTSTSTTAPAGSAASTPRRTPPRGRSSRPGSRPSPTWGRPRSPCAPPAAPTTSRVRPRRPPRLPVHPGRARLLEPHPPHQPRHLRAPDRRTT